MRPEARYQGVIEILDAMSLERQSAEVAFLRWHRVRRFAGSKDRAAIRDCLYEILRNFGSAQALGGGLSGRQLVIGFLRAEDTDLEAVFSGEKYAPACLLDGEKSFQSALSAAQEVNCPDWLWPKIKAQYGDEAKKIMHALSQRAPIFLRVNHTRIGRDELIEAFKQEGIFAEPMSAAPFALKLQGHPRKLRSSSLFEQGFFEFQDIHSQAVIFASDLPAYKKILDYCAGGGGKTLALAARFGQPIYAHDAFPGRMKDLVSRAERAGHDVRVLGVPEANKISPFDLVLCDVPCSGSGSWRRDPEAKWTLDADKLSVLLKKQSEILEKASHLVGPEGELIYVTCSILREENQDQIGCFLSHNPDWGLKESRNYSPLQAGGDGFFIARMGRV